MAISYLAVDDHQLHRHSKYTVIISTITNSVILPNGQYFNMSKQVGYGAISEYSVQVYINGILHTNGIHFDEIADVNDPSHGIGVTFGIGTLQMGDIVVIEWIVNNEI